MKWMIASDLHGSAFYCRQMLDAFEREGADRLLLLGDLLYHGPRNDAIAYFATAGHPVPARVNPAEFYMDLLQMKEDEGLRARRTA